MSKIKQFFENLGYKHKYNTLKTKYEELQERITNKTLSSSEDLEALKEDIKYLKKNYDDSKRRISDLETKLHINHNKGKE